MRSARYYVMQPGRRTAGRDARLRIARVFVRGAEGADAALGFPSRLATRQFVIP